MEEAAHQVVEHQLRIMRKLEMRQRRLDMRQQTHDLHVPATQTTYDVVADDTPTHAMDVLAKVCEVELS